MSIPTRELLVDRVYQYLLAQLSARRMSIGTHLNALTIANELGISRTPVNQAIARLVAEGCVRPGKSRRPVVVAYPRARSTNGKIEFAFTNQTEKAYEAILEQVLDGAYHLGEMLKISRLAKELSVNPVTVARAAEWLANDGLLVRLPRRGWQVVALRVGDLKDLYLVRLHLESLGLRRAVDRIADDVIRDLRIDAKKVITAGEKATIPELQQHDFRFHLTLAEASKSRILVETLEPLLRKSFLMTGAAFRFGRKARRLTDHLEILDAVQARDADAAVARLRTHLRYSLKRNVEIWEHQEL